jgi:3-oxoacyl-[acyl-carrier protein] reductase
MSERFKNKTVLITGAGGDLGSVLCRSFQREGALVAGLHGKRRPEMALSYALELDLQDSKGLVTAVQQLEKELGPVDILINNAGVTRDALLPMLEEEALEKILQVNLKAPLMLCRALLPGMISRRSGCILNISSLASARPQAGQAVYAASKGALESLTRALAVENAARGIRVNALAPGFLESSLLTQLSVSQKEGLLRKIPLARWGRLDEVAEAAVFLCSDQSAYVTGQVFVIDGGMGM